MILKNNLFLIIKKMVSIIRILSLAAIIGPISAHRPGKSVPVVDPQVFYKHTKRSLEGCHAKLKESGALARRSAKSEQFKKRHYEEKLKERSIDYANQETLLNLKSKRDNGTTIIDAENFRILTPENIIGPYYVGGEYIRDDIVDGQEGVELLLDVQIINSKTCEPIANNYLDVWHCNATGVYSGVEAEDTIGLNYLRGVYPTDEEGIVQFKTIFPGWYEGRSTHIHIFSHVNATVQTNNNTLNIGGTDHIGQIYFEDSLVDEISELYPYTKDTNPRTTNEEDMFFPQQNSSGYDAIIEIEYLGTNISDGLIGYMSIAVDLTANHDDAILVANYLD